MKIVSAVVVFVMMVFIVGRSWGQNLVPNPSFEDTLGCPQGYPDLNTKCQYWKSFRITPDYMNNCSSVCGYYNQYGYQAPHSGSAYAGIGVYAVTVPNEREHIGVQLTSQLTIGAKYYISFFVSPSWNNLLTNIACNKIGALVTTYQYSDPDGVYPLPNSCTTKTDSVITDTLNWYQIFGSFIADSTYQYLVIGSFFDDAYVDTLHFPYLVVPQVSYYYLDDVCLSADSLFALSWTGLQQPFLYQNNISLSPNPVQNLLTINFPSPSSAATIAVYDVAGRKIVLPTTYSNNKAELTTTTLPNGIYLLQITNNKTGVSEVGKFVKE